jgi:hypothetical protein
LPGLDLNCNLLDLSLPNSKDYRCDPLAPSQCSLLLKDNNSHFSCQLSWLTMTFNI